MKTLLLAVLVCLGAAAPARADVFTFAREPGASWPIYQRPTPSRVPEPGTLSLMALGAGAVLAAKRRAARRSS